MFWSSRTQIGWVDDETFGDVAAFAQAVKDDEVANEVAVGSRFKHCRQKRRMTAARCAEVQDRSRGLSTTARIDRCRSRRVYLVEKQRRKATPDRSVSETARAR